MYILKQLLWVPSKRQSWLHCLRIFPRFTMVMLFRSSFDHSRPQSSSFFSLKSTTWPRETKALATRRHTKCPTRDYISHNTALNHTCFKRQLRTWLNSKTLLQKHCCGRKRHSLATRETLFQQQMLRLGSKKLFLNQVQNISASRTQILLPWKILVSQCSHGGNNFTSLAIRAAKHWFLTLPASLATQETLQETMLAAAIQYNTIHYTIHNTLVNVDTCFANS